MKVHLVFKYLLFFCLPKHNETSSGTVLEFLIHTEKGKIK